MMLRRHRAERVNRQTTSRHVSPDAPDASPYDDMSKADLLAAVEARGLPKRGSMAVLRARLLEADAATEPGTDAQGPTDADDIAGTDADAPGEAEGDTDDDEGDDTADAEATTKAAGEQADEQGDAPVVEDDETVEATA